MIWANMRSPDLVALDPGSGPVFAGSAQRRTGEHNVPAIVSVNAPSASWVPWNVSRPEMPSRGPVPVTLVEVAWNAVGVPVLTSTLPCTWAVNDSPPMVVVKTIGPLNDKSPSSGGGDGLKVASVAATWKPNSDTVPDVCSNPSSEGTP